MTHLYIRLYGRPDCCLCEQADQLLETLRGELGFSLEKINIDEDPALKDRLLRRIPIVTVNGGHRIELQITEERLRRAFARALQHQDVPPDAAQDAVQNAVQDLPREDVPHEVES
jgi:glutaredoxin